MAGRFGSWLSRQLSQRKQAPPEHDNPYRAEEGEKVAGSRPRRIILTALSSVFLMVGTSSGLIALTAYLNRIDWGEVSSNSCHWILSYFAVYRGRFRILWGRFPLWRNLDVQTLSAHRSATTGPKNLKQGWPFGQAPRSPPESPTPGLRNTGVNQLQVAFNAILSRVATFWPIAQPATARRPIVYRSDIKSRQSGSGSGQQRLIIQLRGKHLEFSHSDLMISTLAPALAVGFRFWRGTIAGMDESRSQAEARRRNLYPAATGTWFPALAWFCVGY